MVETVYRPVPDIGGIMEAARIDAVEGRICSLSMSSPESISGPMVGVDLKVREDEDIGRTAVEPSFMRSGINMNI